MASMLLEVGKAGFPPAAGEVVPVHHPPERGTDHQTEWSSIPSLIRNFLSDFYASFTKEVLHTLIDLAIPRCPYDLGRELKS